MPEQSARKPRLLVVDDDKNFRDIVLMAISEEDFDVSEATTGEEAVKAARAHEYDLVLLDLKMPVMDGLQTLKLLRQESPSTDILMITGYQDVHLAVESIKLGAKEYLTKPIDPPELVQRLKSALRAHAAELRVKNLQAEFSAHLLYELRTPLSTVQSAVGFLMKELAGPTTERQQDVLSHIEHNTTKMISLLNDMIDLTQFESGRVGLEKLPTNLDELIPAVCARFDPLAKAKKVSLKVNINSNIPTLELDPDKIEQVIENLLDNAVKYTNEGGTITITASQTHHTMDGRAREVIEIAVADSGMGIPKEELPFVFDKYKEFLTGKTSQQKTTGIGLIICRNIVEAHNGTMSVASTAGKGSTFKFTLPVDSM
jgi:signal transduction histidine kinase